MRKRVNKIIDFIPHDLATRPPTQRDIIDGLIAEHSMTMVLGQSKGSKSLLSCAMAVCLVYGVPFMGLKTVPSNVLLIQQDDGGGKDDEGRVISGPTVNRLNKFGSAMNSKRKKILYVKVEGFSMHNDYQSFKYIRKLKTDVVMVDSLHSILGGSNPNQALDMGKLRGLKQLLRSYGVTFILFHHITDKKKISVNDIAYAQTLAHLSMGSSVITQVPDALIALVPEENSGRLKKIFIRVEGKRFELDERPFSSTLYDDGESMFFEETQLYTLPLKLGRKERDILEYFKDYPDPISVKELWAFKGDEMSKDTIRKALEKLRTYGMVELDATNRRDGKFSLVKKKGREVEGGEEMVDYTCDKDILTALSHSRDGFLAIGQISDKIEVQAHREYTRAEIRHALKRLELDNYVQVRVDGPRKTKYKLRGRLRRKQQ